MNTPMFIATVLLSMLLVGALDISSTILGFIFLTVLITIALSCVQVKMNLKEKLQFNTSLKEEKYNGLKHRFYLGFLATLLLSIIFLSFNAIGTYVVTQIIKTNHEEVFEGLEYIEPVVSSEECSGTRFGETCGDINYYSDEDQELIDESNELLAPLYTMRRILWILTVLSVLATIYLYDKYSNVKVEKPIN